MNQQDLLSTIVVFSVLFIIYPYLIYPVVLGFITYFRGTKNENERHKYNLKRTYVVCVYNGERFVETKINNIIEIESNYHDYEVFIVSDSSTDNTDYLVSKYKQENIKLIKCPYRMGKANAENYVLQYITGELIIFTDVSTTFSNDCIKYLIPHFYNENVGCVSTHDKILGCNSDGDKTEEGIYVRYEMLLRKMESDLGILSGASGSGYVCRRELAVDINAKLTRDLYTPLLARERGFITISEPRAHCYIHAQNDIHLEFNRKIRTFTGGIDTILSLRQILNPFKYGLYSFGVFSHKILRWLAPFFMTIILLCSGLLITFSNYWLVLFFAQIIFYLFCIYYYINPNKKYHKVIDLAFFFTMTSFASGIAWFNVLTGKHYSVWEPTKRD